MYNNLNVQVCINNSDIDGGKYMKKKYADLSKVKDVVSSNFVKLETPNDSFFGAVCMAQIKKVLKNWKVPRDNEEDETIMDEGYRWLTLYPRSENYSIIAIYNMKAEFVEFYFDIAKKLNFKTRVPYTEDWYLDIVITKKNDVIFLDEEELEEALKIADISQKDYEIVRKTADKIVNKYHKPEEFENLKRIASEYFDKLLNNPVD